MYKVTHQNQDTFIVINYIIGKLKKVMLYGSYTYICA